MKTMLRSASLLALLGTVAAASADVRYTFDFSGGSFFQNVVTVTTSTFLTSFQSFGPADVDSAHLATTVFEAIRFDPAGSDRDAVAADVSFFGLGAVCKLTATPRWRPA